MKAKLALATLVALSLSNVAVADGGPKLSGELHVKHLSTDSGTDDGLVVDTAEVNLKGAVGQGGLKAIYELQAEFAGAANGTSGPNTVDDVTVDTARIIVPGKWGAFVAGKSPSGQYADLYKGVKIFDNASISSGAFNQPNRAAGVLAWKTPKMGNAYGVLATVNYDDENNEKIDAKLARAVYKQGGLTAGIGQVTYDHSDRTRSALGVDYSAKRWQAGATLEKNKDHPTQGTWDVMGVAGTYKFTPNTAGKLGYFKKDHDVDAQDDKTTILNVSHKRGPINVGRC